jgi:hypothetical protein
VPLLNKSPRISQEEGEIRNIFVRVLTSEAERLGFETPSASSPANCIELNIRERYAPMQRLLTREDEQFLIEQGVPAAAAKLRRDHRRCYRQFLKNLRRETRKGRELLGLAMASSGKWDFWALLEHRLLTESSLVYLSWLGWKHAAGVTAAAHDVSGCLDFLLAGPRLPLQAT